MDKLEIRVWWMPQIGMQPFLQDVPSFPEAFRLTETLGRYDLFQFEHRVKPDYANAGGVSYRHPEFTEGVWWDIEEDEVGDLLSDMNERESV